MSGRREQSRSEIVRSRRREQSQKRSAHSSVLATRPLPPITSRGAPAYAVPQRTMPRGSARHYQTAWSVPGMEVQLPAIRITGAGIKARLLSVFLSLLLGTGLYLAMTLPEFHVGSAKISGNQRISADEINSVLQTKGQSIFTLTSGDLETRLRLNYPELESARVSIGLPNLVTVTVVERQPVILWQQGSGYTWIDASGVAFRPRGSTPLLIPVMALAAPPASSTAAHDPLSPVAYISPDLVKSIQTLAPAVPAGVTMEYDPKLGLGWQDTRGWKVYFGSNLQDMPLKLQVYKSLVDSLIKQGIHPTLISVEYANAPYYRISQ